MADRTDTPPSIQDAPLFGGVSRRNVVRAGVWTAPAIVVATAAPSFAASGVPVMTAAWNANSFRYNSNADGTNGVPSANARAAVAINLTVTGGTMDTVSCSFASTGTVQIFNNTTTVARNGTTWSIGNAQIAADGWTLAPSTIPSGQRTTWTFSRGVTGPGTYPLRVLFDSIAGGDFPFTFSFSSPDSASTPSVVATANVVSPFISGAP